MACCCASAAEETSTLSLDGNGVVSATPNEGYITLGVTTYSVKSADCVHENSKSMTSLFSALSDKGVAKKDIQTVNFSIAENFKTVSEPNPDNPKVRDHKQVRDGFVVNNTVRVTVCDLTKFGEILDAVAEGGANTVHSISFGSSKMAEHMTEARKKAVADAMSKAKTISEGLGVKMGRVISVSEHAGRVRNMYDDGIRAASVQSESVPVFDGSLNYSVSVQVRWELTK